MDAAGSSLRMTSHGGSVRQFHSNILVPRNIRTKHFRRRSPDQGVGRKIRFTYQRMTGNDNAVP